MRKFCTALFALFFVFVAQAQVNHLVISQVYGGGGNAGAVYQNDFIEVFNPTSSPVRLNNLSVQYAATAGTSWSVTLLVPTTTTTDVFLQPGQYYLIQEAAGNTSGQPSLPSPDAIGTTNLAATAGKVALVNSTTAITSGTSCPTGATIIDFIGYGTANCFETAVAVGPSSNNTAAAIRNNSGCTDTDNNSTDFSTGTPVPHNSSSPTHLCTSSPAATLTSSTLPAFGNVCINTTAGPNTFTLTGSNLNGSDVTIGPLVGYSFATTSGGTYTPTLTLTAYNGSSQDVFVKFTPTATQSYNGNIPVTGGGATTSVAATGSGINSAPTATAGAASGITTTSATLPGTITQGCSSLSAYGIEYSTTSGFTGGTGTQVAGTNLSATDYSVTINGLSPNTTYYYRAYATSNGTTTYSTIQNFTTAIVTDANAAQLKISQVYGAGGNTGAVYQNDFIELFNPSATAISLNGLSVQYTSAAGAGSWDTTKLPDVLLQPGHYFLIAEAGGANGAALPTPDLIDITPLAAGAGKVALVNGTNPLTGSCPTGTNIIDLVGYGTTATCSETAPAPATTASESIIRGNSGCTDTNNNSVDFSAGAPTPRNSASPVHDCSAPAPTPALTTGSLAAFGNLCINTVGGPNAFTISGTNLNGSDVVIGPLAGYTFSTTSGGTYSSTLTLPAYNGTAQNIYVQFSPTAAQSYDGTIPVNGGGATASIAASGAGVNNAPTVTAAAATTITTSGATLAGSITTGCGSITAYGVEYSTTAGFAGGSGTQVAGSNLSGNNFSVALSGLTSGTIYYYRAYVTSGGNTIYSSIQNFTTQAVAVDANASLLKISQVYGGGGNANATYQNDFIELFNPSATAISLNGLSVQYAGATSSSWDTTKLPDVLLQPGHYFLIAESSGGAVGSPLPTPDLIDITAMAATAGKVALVNTVIPLTGSCPTGASIIDFVGYGSTATCYEGANPSAAPSVTNSIFRKNSGCTDTNDNNADFTAAAVSPRNTSSPVHDCSVPSALTAGALTSFGNVCVNSTAGPNSFTLSGSNLDGSDIVIGPLAGYTFSLSSGGSYTNSVTISGYSGGTVNQTIYVQFAPVAVQSYNGAIPITGGGASTTVASTGSGVNTAPTVTTVATATNVTTSGATLSGTITGGCSITGYGIEYSTVSGFTTGTQVTASNLSSGNFSVALTGLAENTTYYYKAFATNNTGTVYGAQQSFTTNVSAPTGPHIVISQVYGGGGNTGAPYQNDFVELFNPTGSPISINGYSVQYAAANSTTGNFTVAATLTGTLQAGQYYLIQLGAAATPEGVALPTPDATGGTNISTTAGKLILVTGNGAVGITSTGCPAIPVADFVAYGAANCANTAPAAGLSNTTSALRKNAGCTDTGDNSADFATGAPTPRNTASPFNNCTFPQPALTAGSLAPFGNVCVNTASAPGSFTINGSNLSTQPITIGALAGYTYATTANGTYTPTLTLTQSGGTYAQTIYVQFTPTAVQSYNGNITITGGGAATAVFVAASGAGINTAPAVTTGTASGNTINSATLSGSITNNGCGNITAYGVEYSTTAGFATGTGTQITGTNLSGTDFSVVASGLAANTTYYYRAYATNGGGTTYGAQQSFTTLVVTDVNASNLKISQVYGGGGNAGATYQNDFIEIFNPSAVAVSLNGLSVQYAGATGSSWDTTKLPDVLLQPGHYFLIAEASAGSIGSALPTPDVSDITPMAAGAGKVALVSSIIPLTGTCPTGSSIIDLVGYGTTANCAEATAAPAPSATNSIFRKNSGCTDTNDNSADFVAATPNPRNSASSPHDCSVASSLTVSALSSFGNVCVSSTGGPNSFTLSGTNLDGSDVVIGPLAGYTFSTTSGGTYSSTLTLPAYNGTAQTIYVQFSPTAAQSYNGTIPITGGGTSTTLAATGTGAATTPTVAATAATAVTANSAILPGTVTAPCTTVTAYGIEYSTTSGFAGGSGTAVAGSNLSGTNFSVSLTGLTSGTTYYYRAYATSNGNTVYSSIQNFTTQTVTVDVNASQLKISQVYGGGGNSGAAYQNDFIELFNPSATAISLNGLSVQYASATSTNPTWSKTSLLDVLLQPGHYYLIGETSTAAIGSALPTPDATGTIDLAAGAGKVALVASTTTIATGTICPTDATIIDFVGYGSATTCSETAPAPAPSAANSILRKNSGCQDTNDNSADFLTGVPTPRNTASPLHDCSAAPSSLTVSTLPDFGAVCINSNSAANSFTITGSSLDGSAVVVGPLNGYSFSNTAGGTYTPTLALSGYTGGVLNATVFVRLTPTAVQSYNGAIPVSGGGSTPTTVAATGSGINTPPTTTTGAATAVTNTTATLAASVSNTGCGTVTAYGIEYSTTAGFAGGSGTQVAGNNLSGNNFSVDVSGLLSNTAYYYKSYVTTSSGTVFGTEKSFVTSVIIDVNTSLLKISQVYGGGGNTGATYTNDFIEIFNPSTTVVNLSGLSVQYASGGGTSWQVTPLTNVFLQPGQYYLVGESAGTNGTVALPTVDATGTINLSATAGKVALVKGITALSTTCATGTNVIDFVGYGSGADCAEPASATTPSPAPGGTAVNSVFRKNGGCLDTDNNSFDFIAGAAAPRNTASPVNICSTVPVITASSLDAFGNVCIGTTTTHTVTLTAANLTGGAVTIGPLAGYTFATTANGTYTTTLTISGYTGGAFSQDVFVRFSPTAAQNYNGAIPVTGGGASDISITASGTGVSTAIVATTGAVTNFTINSATIAGSTTTNSCSTITSYGVEYSTTAGFTTGTGTQVAGTNINNGAFSVALSGLQPNTTYYYRAYVVNGGTTSYGLEQSFTTLPVAVDANANLLRISQVYGAGGNANAVYQNDFIELFNPSATAINLNGLSVQYASATGINPSWSKTVLPDFLLQPGQYYLIAEASTAAVGTALPTPNTTGTIDLAAGAGKVALVNSSTTITAGTVCPTGANIIDFVGYGSSATCSETAPAPAPSAANSILRKNGGCLDVNNNSTDFLAGAPTPRNSSSPFNNCAAIPITLTATAPANFGAICINTTSSPNSFTITGTNLTGQSITVGPLAGYSFSTTQNGTFTASLTLPQSGGSYAQVVYVLFSPTAAQSYSGNIPLAGGGTTGVVAVSGSGVNTAPTLSTAPATNITASGATLGGTITVTGCSSVTAYGVEYSTTAGFTTGTGTQVSASNLNNGVFSVAVSGLAANTVYYYRAFATNSGGTAYGSEQSFTAAPIITAPVATAATQVKTNSFIANWNAVTGATGYRLDVSTSPDFNATTTTRDLLISEYVEGSANEKYIELYNGTGAAVNLSNYRLELYANGSTTATASVTLSSSLANGSAIVYQNPNATLYAGTALNNAAVAFDGNDAIALYKISTGTYVDIFGRIGENPGTAWTAGSYSTADKTLRRKATVNGGVTTNPSSGFPTLTTEWDLLAQDDISNLGAHTTVASPSFVPGYENLAVTGTTQLVSGLTPGVTYYYRVRATTGTATSNNSNTITVSTLPPILVQFINLKAEDNGQGVTVSFSNVTEGNLSNYTIERSTDGTVFTAITQLTPTKNDGTQASYLYLDLQPGVGTIYYRVKATDAAGTVTYSNVVSLSVGPLTQGLTIYPNPIVQTTLRFRVNGMASGTYQVKVISAIGQVVYTETATVTGTSLSRTLLLYAVKPGIYYLQVVGPQRFRKSFFVRY